jgi:cobalamin biosynthesis Co2+ chelatase CbiK
VEQVNENNEKVGGEGEGEGEGEGQETVQNEELSPQEELQKFLDNHKDYENLFKMLKVGVPIISVEQKAKLNGYDMDLLNELVEKAHNAYPEKINI